MTPDSFSFRYACYETFGWTPEDVKQLDEEEAWRLAIVLSEVGKYIYKQQEEARKSGSRPANSVVDFEMDDDEAWDIDMVEVREEVP